MHVGFGFILPSSPDNSSCLALTCAHVVADALGEPSAAEDPATPFGNFRVDFPLTDNGGFFNARVKAGPTSWHPKSDISSGRSQPQDIAVLEIDRPQDQLRAIALSGDQDYASQIDSGAIAFGGAVRSSGDKRRVSYWISCEVSPAAHGFIQVDAKGPKDAVAGRFIEEGFSGGPVLEKDTGYVIGMVSRVFKGRGKAQVTPMAELRSAIALTPHQTTAPPSTSLPIPFDLQLPTFDCQFPRPAVHSAISDAAQTAFLTYIYGSPETGKSTALSQFISSSISTIDPSKVIWYACHSNASYHRMISSFVPNIFEGEVNDLDPRSLFRFLHKTQSYLVIDGLDDANSPSFNTLIEISAKTPPPSRIFITSVLEPELKYIKYCAVYVPLVERAAILNFVSEANDVDSDALAEALTNSHYSALELKQILSSKQNKDFPNITESSLGPVFNANLLQGFSSVERVFISILNRARGPVSVSVIGIIANEIGLKDPGRLASMLVQRGIIKSFSTNRFVFLPLPQEILEQLGGQNDSDKHEIILARAYDKTLDVVRQNARRWSMYELSDLVYAIQHYQSAPNTNRHRARLITKGVRALARAGQHRLIVEILRKEIDLIPKTSMRWGLQLAQSYVAIGDVRAAFYSLKEVYAASFANAKNSDSEHLRFCYRLADTMVNANRPDLGHRLLHRTLEKLDHSKVDVTNLSMAISLRDWCSSMQGSQPNNERLRQLLSDAELTAKPIAIGVQSTRLGIQLYEGGDYTESKKMLAKAVEAFRGSDVRGLIWSLSHYCYLHLQIGLPEQAKPKLEELIDLTERFELYGEDSYFHFKIFASALRGNLLHDRCLSLLQTAKERANLRELGPFDLEFFDALEAALVNRLDIGIATHHDQNDGLLAHVAKFETSSQLSTSYVQSVLQSNPDQIIEKLFESHSARQLFENPFYCRLISECAAKVEFEKFSAKYITCNWATIKTSEDWAKIHFANLFHRMGNESRSIELLSIVSDKKNFYYLNSAANCYQKTDPEASYQLNLDALDTAHTPARRSRILNNLCAQVLRMQWSERFNDAEKFITEALDLRPDHFHWPERTNLAYRIQVSKEAVPALCEEYLTKGQMSERAAAHIASLISDAERKMAFLDWYEKK